MHEISSNLTVNNDKLIDNFIFAVMHSSRTWSSSGVQAGACKIVNSYSLDWKIPELKHPAPKKLLLPFQIKQPWQERLFPTDLLQSYGPIKKTSDLLHIYVATFFCVAKTDWILRHHSCSSDLLGASLKKLSLCAFVSKFWLFIFYYWCTESKPPETILLIVWLVTSKNVCLHLRLLLSTIFHY